MIINQQMLAAIMLGVLMLTSLSSASARAMHRTGPLEAYVCKEAKDRQKSCWFKRIDAVKYEDGTIYSIDHHKRGQRVFDNVDVYDDGYCWIKKSWSSWLSRPEYLHDDADSSAKRAQNVARCKARTEPGIKVATADGNCVIFEIDGDRPTPTEQARIDAHIDEYNSLFSAARPSYSIVEWESLRFKCGMKYRPEVRSK
jgi:hypothetical protein